MRRSIKGRQSSWQGGGGEELGNRGELRSNTGSPPHSAGRWTSEEEVFMVLHSVVASWTGVRAQYVLLTQVLPSV